MKSLRFSASRTADVATASTGAPYVSTTLRQRASAATPRSIAARGEVLEVVVARLTQPHHLLVAGDDLESAVGRHARHHHVHRVRPDVDRRQHVGHRAPWIGTRPLHLGPGGSVDGRMYPISHLPSV
jgi:hypothetical protein